MKKNTINEMMSDNGMSAFISNKYILCNYLYYFKSFGVYENKQCTYLCMISFFIVIYCIFSYSKSNLHTFSTKIQENAKGSRNWLKFILRSTWLVCYF